MIKLLLVFRNIYLDVGIFRFTCGLVVLAWIEILLSALETNSEMNILSI